MRDDCTCHNTPGPQGRWRDPACPLHGDADKIKPKLFRVYLIGSLGNVAVPSTAATLRAAGHEVFASWYAAGPEADRHWEAYERGRGLTFEQALRDHAAQSVFNFDRSHLDRCDAAVLLMPAGRSGHLELGYAIGKGKRGFICHPNEPERWDVMAAFAERVCIGVDELVEALK